MHDAYFSSMLVVAGLCLGLSIQSMLVGFSPAPAATTRHLSRLALLEAAFCLGFYTFSTTPAVSALRWYCLLVVAPLACLPRVLSDLVMHLTGAPERWVGLRRFAGYSCLIGATCMVLDAALQTGIMYSDIRVFGPPSNLRFPSPTWGGFVFLACWGTPVAASLGRMVTHGRSQRHLRPLLYGAGAFALISLLDLITVASGVGFYQLQHFGFLSLLLGASVVLARQNREGAERLRVTLQRLEEQRHQLLHEGPRVQQQKLESLGTLASGVAHEVLNPIASIMNYARLIRQRRTEAGAMESFVDEVLDECNRVNGIVKSLLTFARREDLIRLPEDPRDMVDETCRLLELSLASDAIQLEVIGGTASLSVRCTRQQIQQVLLNLLQNAQHAVNAAHPGLHADKRIRISIHEVVNVDAPEVRIDVEDWGTGISEQDLPRVFDPFFTNRPDRTGTGLGLSVSHGIVVDHGGSLLVESSRGHTRFRLVLPAVAAEKPADTVTRADGRQPAQRQQPIDSG